MTSTAADDFENDWTFVDRDGKVEIQPREDSVCYSKSPSTRDEVVVSPSEVPARDDSEGEAEFEVLTGFQCHPPPVADEESQAAEDAEVDSDNLLGNGANLEADAGGEPVLSQQNSCHCAADDGIMIISNHFCSNKNADAVDGEAVDDSLASECDQEDPLSSNVSLDTADGWRELPQLSESGAFSFPSDSNSLEDDNDIEPIPEEDVSQDFVDLSHESCEEMVESRCSVFSFDSDLFNQDNIDEDTDNEEEHCDITEAIEDGNDRDQDAEIVEETGNQGTAVGSSDGSFIYVDVPTLFVLLGVTTALGFSIGYGLSVYISSQALQVSGDIKRPGPKTASPPLSSDPMEPLDDVPRDFVDQLTMWKLEDRLDPQREQEPETELGNLFDTKARHEKLQKKHFKLMSLHENVRQRLRMSKVMSWYWRLKYEEEKSKQGGGSDWNKALQDQLEHMEQLYLHEKHTADLWRRMNENRKLRRAVSSGIKFDKYWRDFLHRWRKVEDGSQDVNESQMLTDSTENDEKPKELTTEGKKLEQNAQRTLRMRGSTWREFRNRWTKDSQMKGPTGESSSKSEKCASEETNERRDLSVSPEERSLTTTSQQTDLSSLLSPTFVESSTEKSAIEREASVTNPEDREASKSLPRAMEGQSENEPEDISKEFKKGEQFDNILFPREFAYSWLHDKSPSVLKSDGRDKENPSASAVTLSQRPFVIYVGSERVVIDSMSQLNALLFPWKFMGDKSIQKADDRRVKSYQEYFAKRKCKKESELQNREPSKPRKLLEKQDESVSALGQLPEQLPRKQKQMVRNLRQRRGKEIPKQRIKRRELKQKEKEAKLRLTEAHHFLSELKQERRRIKMEKKKLQRAWRALKREKKKFSRERKDHERDKKGLEKFTVKLKKEKKKIKKLKGKFKKKMKKLLAKEKEGLKMTKKMEAEKRKEVQRLRDEIAQEKDSLRKQQRTLKSLKKAARKEFKKWLMELRRLKRKEKERRKVELEKQRVAAKKNREKAARERRRIKEYEAVIREQVKYDKDKRRKKGEYGETEKEKIAKGEWRKSDGNDKREGDSERKGKKFDREFFREQLENIKEWLASVHKKTIEKQKTYWESLFAPTNSVYEKTIEKQKTYWARLFAPTIFHGNGEADKLEPAEEEDQAELKEQKIRRERSSEWEKENVKELDAGEKKGGQSDWEEEKKNIIKLMSGMEKRDCEQKGKEKWEMTVRKSELMTTSEGRALAGFVNLTFNVDLVKTLLKGMDKVERESKITRDEVKAADSTSFITVSKESAEVDSGGGSDVKRKKSPKKLKIPEDRQWLIQVPIESEELRLKHGDLRQRTTPEGPIPPEGVRLSPEGWYEKRSKVKKKGKNAIPQGPILSENEDQERSGGDKMRKRDITEGKVCISDDSENREAIPPPDWVFERAKDRADQRSAPWYERRAQDRYSQRSSDEHVTQFPCGRNRKHRADQRSTPWYDRRARDRSFQRSTEKHATHFPCGRKWRRCSYQQSTPWYDRRARDRNYQRRTDRHATQFPHGQTRKRNHEWYFERASDRAFQRLNYVPWYSRRGDGRESQRRDGVDSWFLEHGHYRDHFHDWMPPQGPSMDEHRQQ